MILCIRDLLYEEGFTIEGARKQLGKGKQEQPPVPARTAAVLEQVRKDVLKLLQLAKE